MFGSLMVNARLALLLSLAMLNIAPANAELQVGQRQHAGSVALCSTPSVASVPTSVLQQGKVTFQDKTDIGESLRLPVYKWSNDAVPTKGLIFAIHGATLYARRFDAAAKHFADQGFPVYALDLRGFGKWRTEGDSFAEGDKNIHYTRSEEDIVKVLTKIKEQNPDQKIYCLGESLGANLAVWIGTDHPELANGLILVSPCVKAYMHLSPRLLFDIVYAYFHREKEMNLGIYIKPYLSDDKEATAEYMNDPVNYYNMSGLNLYKSIKTNTLALSNVKKLPQQMPILVVAGKKDKIYKASAIKPFVAEMGSCNKTVDIIPNRGHLLIESPRVKPEVLSIIDNWLTTGKSPSNEIAGSDNPIESTSN